MVMYSGAILQGLGLGIGAAAPIGPVNVEIARRTIRFGYRGGFLVGCGAVTVDITYAILSTLGIRQIARYPRIMALIGIAGAMLLACLGIMSLLAALRHRKLDIGSGPAPPAGHHYLTGLAMTFLNPFTIAFWFLGVPAVAGKVTANLPLVCVGVFIATISWVCVFTGLWSVLVRLSPGGRGRGLIVADLLGGLTLLFLSAQGIWRVAHQFL